jgi:hypothetical protein
LFALSLPGDGAQCFAQIAQDADFQDIVFVYLRRTYVDVHNPFVAVGIPLFRMVFDHVVADADDYVGLFKSKGYPILSLETDRSE